MPKGLRTILLALTGMGNAVLASCMQRCNVRDILVVTRSELGPYPYHPCEHLADACCRLGVACITDVGVNDASTIQLFKDFAPDIILAATFHQIVHGDILRLPLKGSYNIHPSLLPAFKGPMPTNWSIIHGESKTGVTVHKMTEGLDEGCIALQRAVKVGRDTDGELRRRLWRVAGALSGELLDLAGANAIALREQHGPGSRHPRVHSRQGLKLLKTGGFDPERIRRGVTPWPGVGAITELLANIVED